MRTITTGIWLKTQSYWNRIHAECYTANVGLFIFRCDTVEKLRQKLPSLDKEILDSNKFKDFYQFTFNYAKNPGQKGLDLDMALAYWNIVLTGRFQFLDIWSRFLKVLKDHPNRIIVESERNIIFLRNTYENNNISNTQN